MKTYHVMLKTGRAREIHAVGYSKGQRGSVFMLRDGKTMRIAANEISRVEERLDGAPEVASGMAPAQSHGEALQRRPVK